MTFSNPKILFVMAASAEYGAQLQQLIKPLMIGVGPVEAAVNLTAELANLTHQGKKPDLIVSLGSAGSQHLKQTEVYQAASLSYRDMDASALGFEKGTTPFLDIPAIVEMEHFLSSVPKASLSTGANIVSGEDYEAINAEMVDMESFAIWRVCEKFAMPMIGLRGISDGEKELQQISDWTEYLHIIDEKLGLVLQEMKREFGGWQDCLA
ncbi:5'-methylthioadenosine/S-adenosylhomocysteine nucleosidase [Cohaesibacter gelatinilyticus]|uniref:Adenosylhomocysteine nucleosidase n=1 Tax=Cohaesibacter gelatinilyticus TaxID=372072 RepID=A0A285NDI9_9HYPH|nr:5'-methylthioadenosine/S-adenosylhomocysteine nucleosidase [Cohaesibacter gelatinilyticus]SNZ07552.1 adenosylhomocysteine nucleosidase [Cohaesibacter gelatinilyticus]